MMLKEDCNGDQQHVGPIPKEIRRITAGWALQSAVPYPIQRSHRVAFTNRFVSSQRSVRLQAVPEHPGLQKGGQAMERVCESHQKIMQGRRQMVTVFTTTKSW